MANDQAGKAGEDILKTLASETVKQGENLRTSVRNLTLQALESRELTLEHIKGVLGSISAGVNLGLVQRGPDATRAIKDAVAGMDEAVSRAVDASRIALQKLAAEGRAFTDDHLARALDDVRRVEGEFLEAVQKAANASTGKLREQWAEALGQFRLGGTDTGASVATAVEAFSQRMTGAIRETQAFSLEAARTFADNFATLASGILIGMSEAFEAHRTKRGRDERS